ncbi:FAD-dependent oxidoreductase [Clostridium estertheticum]|uniref:FAD-dependent oxidoreductase n=1 Tax=Clostridium estertheticum TaxID=238834 RepID=UPI001C6EC6AC|nr:FAD-dependent oxidoreductase [Clostridium estertheticum]MBW9174032.1 FAD-dependent oxidoreductase [Clostridium estertheticum]WLC77615.1 FAD-dependent oxidoreductase [Clostridium estertheticum]
MSGKYDALFTPFKIGKTEIKNRIVMCPMGGTSLIEDGKFNEPTAKFYLERAKGGVGLIIPGIAPVQDVWGRGNWLNEARSEFLGPVKELMKEIHKYDTKLFMQLGAGIGRTLPITSGIHVPDSNLEYAMFAPSVLPNVWAPEKMHRALTIDEIHKIINAMIEAAKLAQEAGIDGVEIHAIHEGYLLDQFSIENTNHRTDEYGGSLENRMRFVCEIIKGIKEACGNDFPVIVRYSVASKMKGFNSGALPGEPYKEFGRSMEESPAVARMLEAAGCDALNADNGSYDSWYWAHPPMYMPMACNLPESIYIKKFVNIPVICAGRMEDPEIATEAITSGEIDGVGIARQLLADPEYPNKVKNEDTDNIRPCIACHNGCFARLFAGLGTSCALNPAAMQEAKYVIKPAGVKKKIAIVGSGIGGMEVARICAIRGHEVTLYEKSDVLGGVFNAAAAPDFKEADKKLIKWYIKQINDLKVNIKMNTEVTPELINEIKPDSVVIATGAKPKVLPVPGFENDNVIGAIDLLLDKKQVGDKVAVIGGGLTGCEIAYDLAKKGKKVTVVEMMDDILQVKLLCAANSNMLRELLAYYNVDVLTSTKLCSITANGIKVSKNNVEKEIPTDSVVIAAGYNPSAPLADLLKDKYDVHVIGDADHVGSLLDVVWAAYDVALKI